LTECIVWCHLKPFEAALKLSFEPWTVWFPLKSIIWRKYWMFSSKTLISFRLKKERHGHLCFFLNVNYSLNTHTHTHTHTQNKLRI